MATKTNDLLHVLLDQAIIDLIPYGIMKYGAQYVGVGLNYLPDSPNDIVAIWHRGGFGRSQKEETARYSNASVQITIRGESKVKSVEMGEIVIENLHGYNGFYNGIQILDCQAEQGEPVSLGQDESGRHEFSINFIVTYSL